MVKIHYIDPVPLDELTLGEIDALEEHSQVSVDMISKIVTDPEDPDVVAMPKGRIFRALALIQLQRDDPDATFDDTSNVSFINPQAASADPTVVASLKAGDDPNPPSPAPEPPPN